MSMDIEEDDLDNNECVPLDLFKEVQFARVIVIVGPPAAGKTTLTKKLKELNPSFHVVHSDDYIPYGFVESVYVMIGDARQYDGPMIIEGVQTARMLRAGLKEGWQPDLIIEVIAEQSIRTLRFFKRDGREYPYSMEKSIKKVFDEYKKNRPGDSPRIVSYAT